MIEKFPTLFGEEFGFRTRDEDVAIYRQFEAAEGS